MDLSGGLEKVRLNEVKTHSFVEKENRLLRYVSDRNLVNIGKAEMDFSIYKQDVEERHGRIPVLSELYSRKLEHLEHFQKGIDIWKNRKYSV